MFFGLSSYVRSPNQLCLSSSATGYSRKKIDFPSNLEIERENTDVSSYIIIQNSSLQNVVSIFFSFTRQNWLQCWHVVTLNP